MRNQQQRPVVLATLLLIVAPAAVAEEMKTVLGPSNLFLHDGANALMQNDGEKGVKLTLQGLQTAKGTAEFKMAHSNLCAGYLLIDNPEEALKYCNKVLENDTRHWRTYNNRALVYMRLQRFDEAEADIRKGQALRPGSRNLKIVKGMYLDETKPVRENIELDERRDAAENGRTEAD